MKGAEMFDAMAHIDEDLINICVADGPIHPETAKEPAFWKRALPYAALAAGFVLVLGLFAILHIGGEKPNIDPITGDPTAAPTTTPEPGPTEAPDLKIPTIMLNGKLYYISFEKVWDAPEGPLDGTIASAVPANEFPTEDGTANDELLIGAPYVLRPDGVLAKYDEEWRMFYPSEAEPSDPADAPQVFAGKDTFFILDPDGSLYGWGNNEHGQVGNGSGINAASPVHIADGLTPVYVGETVLALSEDGTLYGWGRNDMYQLGLGDTEDRSTPVELMRSVKQVEENFRCCYALTESGELYEWGYTEWSFEHKPGEGNKEPTLVLENVERLMGKYAVTKDGKLYSDYGDGFTEHAEDIAAAWQCPTATVIEGTDGALYLLPFGGERRLITEDHSSVTVSDGDIYILKDDGKLYVYRTESDWYDAPEDEKYVLTPVMEDVAYFTAAWDMDEDWGYNYNFALKNNGELWSWGMDYSNAAQGQAEDEWGTEPVCVANGVRSVVTDAVGTYIVKLDGTVWATGMREEFAHGALGDGTKEARYGFVKLPLENIANVYTRLDQVFVEYEDGTDSVELYTRTFAVGADGSVWAWGWNGDGVLGTLSVKATVLSPELVVFEGEPAETNYDEHDYEVLRDFFETADENGVKNGEKCFPNYDPEDPTTWFSKSGIYANAVYWNGSGKVSSVHLEGTEEEDLILTGRIDPAQFDSLTDFGLWNAVIESVVADNMVTAGSMQLSNLKFPYVAREARFTGAYAARLYMLSASHTLVEMTGEATIETWLLPAFRIEVDVEGMGYAGVVSWDDENAYEVRLRAEPMEGASFLGWFDEKGTLISTELTYELYGEASGRSCEGRHAELAYTARFTDHYHDREWAVNAAFITAQAIGRVHGMEFDRDEAEWNVQDYDGIVEEYVSFTDRNGHGELVTFFHPDRLVDGAVPPSYFDLWPAEADIPGGIDAWRSRYDSETVTITPDDIRAHGCTATEGEEYVRAAYECWAEKLAQRLVKAGSDDPARCTEAALVYCEPDEDYPGNWFFRIAVKPASTENFAAFTDWTLGFIDGRFPAEYYGWVNFWGRTELTENADGSFTAPFILDTGA